MRGLLHYFLLLLLPTIILVHLYYAPYTKVEESFNIQAIHDILTFGVPFEDVPQRLALQYDHVSFPGVVPRTFVGALLVAEATRPLKWLLKEPEMMQTAVRAVLGLYNAFALLLFQDAISQAFGRVAAYWYILLQVSQFHVMYYASRTLPNMFAFGLTTTASSFLILSNFGPRSRRASRNRLALYLLTVAGIIFRSELGLFLFTETVWIFFVRHVSLRYVIIPAGLISMTAALLVTVGVDSFFWQRFPLWPEWVAFRYNTLEGKSTDWGTSPWHFYFSNSVPRLMMNPMSLLICIPVALADRSTRRFGGDILAPLLAFVALYSALPHKEWRFILYIIPGLTAVAASGASWIWTRRFRSFFYRVLALVLLASTIASFVASMGLLAISSLNYPGAIALRRLHGLAHGERPLIRVHLDNLACQTGVTRFLERKAPSKTDALSEESVWFYDKSEDEKLLAEPAFWERFDYVVAEDVSRIAGKWDVVEEIKAYTGIGLLRPGQEAGSIILDEEVGRNYQTWKSLELWSRKHVTSGWWIKVRMEPRLMILKKRD